MTNQSEQTLGRYRLISLLGEGGMGRVYRAWDETLQRNVAIKILPPELLTDRSRVNRFLQEARAASALNHPHVMAVYDVGEHDGVHFIAMELIDGTTLRELSASPMDVRKAVKLTAQVAEALAAAHANGIIHRDLKPENIMVGPSGYAKVLDFGLAKLRLREPSGERDSRTLPKETDPGVVMGTVGYMSPEQAAGNPVDHRSDIFSLGCVLYELTTGRRAFHGSSTVDTLHKILHSEPEPVRSLIPDTPAELGRIVRKALAKDPDERYQTAKDLAIDLRELLRDIDTNPSGAEAPTSLSPRPRRWLWPALIALIVAAVAIGIVSWRRPAAPASPAPSAMRVARVTASGKVIAAAISPDGKFVSYVVSDQGEQSLHVRQMASGQSLQLIAPERVAYWGIAFSPDGTIYFGRKRGSPPEDGIFQISPLGGQARKVIAKMDSQPTFSPDGRRMAFLRAGFPTPDQSALIVASVDGSEARTLATARLPEVFAPIFFAGASWSPDGKIIATVVMNRRSFSGRIVGIEAATGAITTIASPDWSYAAQVAWLPDQSGLVAIAERGNDGRLQVWHVPYPEGPATQITNDLYDYRSVSLTADGKSLLTIGQDISADVWECRQGSAPKRITSAKYEGALGLDTLPDGRIVFTSPETGKMNLWLMNADGSGRTRVTRDDHQNSAPVVTPDGQSIVYVSVTPQHAEVCRINLDGSERRALARTDPDSSVSVSPDGKWVAYQAIDSTAQAAGNVVVLARVSVDGGAPANLTDYLAALPAHSPDGKQIALYYRYNQEMATRLGLIPFTGGKPTRSFDFPPPFFFGRLRWTADGKGLVVNTAPSDRANLWLVPIDGSRPRRLTNFTDRTLMAFAPLRGGDGWVVSRGDQSRDAVLITGFRR